MVNAFKKIAIMLGSMILSWLIFLLIYNFAGLTDENGKTSAALNWVSAFGSIAISFFVVTISDYNRANKIRAQIPKLEWDISATEQTAQGLISRAQMVVNSQFAHESETFIKVSEARGTRYDTIQSASEFRAVLENYPKLTSDNSVMSLLAKIENCEVALLQQRRAYTSAVADYNAQIHQFPLSLFRMKEEALIAAPKVQTISAE